MSLTPNQQVAEMSPKIEALLKELRPVYNKEAIASALTQALAFHAAVNSRNEKDLFNVLDMITDMLIEGAYGYFESKKRRQ